MFSWWNSLETVSAISTLAQWLIALVGVVVLALGLRVSTLQDRAMTEERSRVADDKQKAQARHHMTEDALKQATARVETIEHKQRPRTLSDPAVAEIQRILKGSNTNTKITITTLGQDEEVKRLAMQLTELFLSCGFDLPHPGGLTSPDRHPPFSVSVPRSFQNDSPLCKALTVIVTDLGYPDVTTIDDGLAEDNLTIQIGQKQ